MNRRSFLKGLSHSVLAGIFTLMAVEDAAAR